MSMSEGEARLAVSPTASCGTLRRGGPAAWWQMVRGFVSYFTNPTLRAGFDGPFNGQRARQALIRALVERLGTRAFVETGTFRGTTAEYIAATVELPVFSVELDPYAFGFCKARFLRDRRVHLHYCDSRTFLRELAASGRAATRLLFYLDAHWNADLPLRDEIDIVFDSWEDAIVVVDDFAVPHDDGYGFDDYGPGEALSLDYLRSCRHRDLEAFFPATGSNLESGARRGCCVLVRGAAMRCELDLVPLLRRWGRVADS